MILTGRTLVLILTMALASGGAAWGVHALMTSAAAAGTDYGLDTDGNGKFDFLVVEAEIALPQAGTWDVYADLSTSSPPTGGSCGTGGGVPPPVPILVTASAYGPVAYVYERYFFPAGTQTVRMAFSGTDIARGGVDGPYTIHARLSLGGILYGGAATTAPIRTDGFVEWSYTTHAYAESDFEAPVRPAYFTGGHSDQAVDVDADGLADFLVLQADVHVNLAGHYSLNGYLSAGDGTDVIRIVAYAYRDFDLAANDTSIDLRFRGDQIRQTAVNGPWSFSLTLYGPIQFGYGNVTPGPAGDLLPPQPVYYPETLCGTTSAYRAGDFDDTVELVRYTGSFEELTPDANGDGTYDSLVIRAEVEVYVSAGFDLSGVLRPSTGSTEVARADGQAWLREGVQVVEFAFPGPQIRGSDLDGPYEATLSITPGAWGIDPTTTYTTRAYRATDFDAAYPNGTRDYWIGNLTGTPSGSSLSISVSVVRAPDMSAVVVQDTLVMTVTDAAGSVVGAFKDPVYLDSGATQLFVHTLDGLSGTYTITAVLGPPDAPVDQATIVVTV